MWLARTELFSWCLWAIYSNKFLNLSIYHALHNLQVPMICNHWCNSYFMNKSTDFFTLTCILEHYASEVSNTNRTKVRNGWWWRWWKKVQHLHIHDWNWYITTFRWNKKDKDFIMSWNIYNVRHNFEALFLR